MLQACVLRGGGGGVGEERGVRISRAQALGYWSA